MITAMFIFTTAEMDYTSVSMEEVVFQPGNSTRCFNISTLPDDTVESNETFVVLLTTSDPDVIIDLTTTTVIIQNEST